MKNISVSSITKATIFSGTQELLIPIEYSGGFLHARNATWSMKTDSF